MKTIISPSILGGSFSNMEKIVSDLDKSKADYIHFDVMDGDFVPNLTFGPQFISNLRLKSKKVFDDIRALENAGAWAVEVEVIPSKVLEIISPKTKLVAGSIGAGSGGDVQFLFAQDLLGDGPRPFPRHSKQYCNLNEIRIQMQVMRKNAFKQFDQEIKNGLFPSPEYEVKSHYEEIEKLEKYIEKFDG